MNKLYSIIYIYPAYNIFIHWVNRIHVFSPAHKLFTTRMLIYNHMSVTQLFMNMLPAYSLS
jgi:hypothetical protein